MVNTMTSDLLIKISLVCVPAWIVNSALNLLIPLQKASPLVKRASIPVDLGKTIWGRRILGDSTTFLGIFTALFVGFLIQLFFPFIPGVLIGLGMNLGHTLGSFIKRRLGVKSGDFIPILDHGDGMLVTGAILYFMGYISLYIYAGSFITTLMFYPLICYIAYRVGLRERPL